MILYSTNKINCLLSNTTEKIKLKKFYNNAGGIIEKKSQEQLGKSVHKAACLYSEACRTKQMDLSYQYFTVDC